MLSLKAIEHFVAVIQVHTVDSFIILMGLWAVHILNYVSGYRLNGLGIVPRQAHGIVGIIFAPFLHGNFNHIFFNSFPLFALMTLVMTAGLAHFYAIATAIIALSGLLIWCIARPGTHIGASAVIMGFLGYLLSSAYFAPGFNSVVVALVCLYYFGGLILSLFPSEKSVSWEGHVCGLIAGIGVYSLSDSLTPLVAWYQSLLA